MRLLLRTAAVFAFGLLLFAQTARAAETPDTSLAQEVDNYLQEASGGADDPTTLRVYFSKGIRMKTADGVFSLKIGGRLMWDTRFEDSDDIPHTDSTFFRRVRFYMAGDIYKHTTFKVQIEFATSSSDGNDSDNIPDLKDVYVGLKKFWFVSWFKAGHQKEPFGLEQLTSSKYIFLMERAAPTNAFTPGRNAGFNFHGTFTEDKRVGWWTGIFKETDNNGQNVENGNYNFTLRIAAWFLEDKENGQILHVGIGFSFRDPSSETQRYRARPGTGSGSRLVSTGTFSADEVTLFNAELAFTYRSIVAALEFFAADTSGVGAAPDQTFTGWYVMIGWWITGENVNYSKKKFAFDRAKVDRMFHDAPGPGAWQLVFRYDTLDLTDTPIIGGEQDTFTFGINWHWNPNTRVMFNIVFASVEFTGSPDIDTTYFQWRWQVDF